MNIPHVILQQMAAVPAQPRANEGEKPRPEPTPVPPVPGCPWVDADCGMG